MCLSPSLFIIQKEGTGVHFSGWKGQIGEATRILTLLIPLPTASRPLLPNLPRQGSETRSYSGWGNAVWGWSYREVTQGGEREGFDLTHMPFLFAKSYSLPTPQHNWASSVFRRGNSCSTSFKLAWSPIFACIFPTSALHSSPSKTVTSRHKSQALINCSR